MLLRSPGPISPDTYSGHIRRRALCPNRLRNGMSQRSSSSCQSDILPTMGGPSKSRPPMSHRKTDLGIPCRSKSPKVVLVPPTPPLGVHSRVISEDRATEQHAAKVTTALTACEYSHSLRNCSQLSGIIVQLVVA